MGNNDWNRFTEPDTTVAIGAGAVAQATAQAVAYAKQGLDIFGRRQRSGEGLEDFNVFIGTGFTWSRAEWLGIDRDLAIVFLGNGGLTPDEEQLALDAGDTELVAIASAARAKLRGLSQDDWWRLQWRQMRLGRGPLRTVPGGSPYVAPKKGSSLGARVTQNDAANPNAFDYSGCDPDLVDLGLRLGLDMSTADYEAARTGSGGFGGAIQNVQAWRARLKGGLTLTQYNAEQQAIEDAKKGTPGLGPSGDTEPAAPAGGGKA